MRLPKLKTLIKEQLTPQENGALLKFVRVQQEIEGRRQTTVAKELEPLAQSIENGTFRFDIVKQEPSFSDLFADLGEDAPRMGVFNSQELRDLNKIRDKYFSWYGASIFKPEGREEANLKRVWNRVWKGRQQ